MFTIILTKKNVASLIIKMVPTILILNKKYKIKSNEEVKLVPRIARDVDFTDWPLVFMCSNTAHSIWSTLDPWNRDIIYLLLCKPCIAYVINYKNSNPWIYWTSLTLQKTDDHRYNPVLSKQLVWHWGPSSYNIFVLVSVVRVEDHHRPYM